MSINAELLQRAPTDIIELHDNDRRPSETVRPAHKGFFNSSDAKLALRILGLETDLTQENIALAIEQTRRKVYTAFSDPQYYPDYTTNDRYRYAILRRIDTNEKIAHQMQKRTPGFEGEIESSEGIVEKIGRRTIRTEVVKKFGFDPILIVYKRALFSKTKWEYVGKLGGGSTKKA